MVDEVVQRELRFREALRRLGLLRASCWTLHGVSMRLTMSPMPRMRLAMRSGWNSSSESGFSPALMNLMGLPVTCTDGKRAAATGVAVHLRHDDAVEVDALGERGAPRSTTSWPVMASTTMRIWSGLTARLMASASSIISLVDVQAARRVDDDDVAQVVDGVLHAFLRDCDRVLPVAAIDAHADLVAERLELIGGSRTVHVARDEQGRVLFLLQTIRELGCGSRLARALQADEHDDVGNAAREDELRVGATQTAR